MITEELNEIQSAEDKFYSEYFYFSYSSMNKLLWNPVVFYQLYVMKLKDEKTSPALTNGKLIHLLLLNEHDFKDEYIISADSLPAGNTKTVIDRLYVHYKELVKNGDERVKLEDFDNAILDILLDMNLHQSLKTDVQRIEKIINKETINYWEFLVTSLNKTVIDQQTYDYCTKAVDVIKNTPEFSNLMGLNVTEFDNIEVFNEIELREKLTNHVFGLKGILDNLVINHDNKTICINDLKTTSKELKDFPESVEYYSYWLQAVIYCILVSLKYSDLIEKQGYKLSFNFVVLDKNLLAYSFPVSEDTLKIWFDRFKDEALTPSIYHYTNKKYYLPYKFCTKQVVI
jgi:hypothetical protein